MTQTVQVVNIEVGHSFGVWVLVVLKAIVDQSHVKGVSVQWTSVGISRRERNVGVTDFILSSSNLVAGIVSVTFGINGTIIISERFFEQSSTGLLFCLLGCVH